MFTFIYFIWKGVFVLHIKLILRIMGRPTYYQSDLLLSGYYIFEGGFYSRRGLYLWLHSNICVTSSSTNRCASSIHGVNDMVCNILTHIAWPGGLSCNFFPFKNLWHKRSRELSVLDDPRNNGVETTIGELETPHLNTQVHQVLFLTQYIFSTGFTSPHYNNFPEIV